MQRVLLIGAGGIGRRHLYGFTHSGRAELAVCEPDEERRKAAAEEWNITECYDTLDAAPLDRFDAAVLCAPAHLHLPLGTRCVEAGLPLLMEKPLAVTMDGVEAFRDLVRERGVPVRLGYIRRCTDIVQQFRDQLRAGRAGTLRLVRFLAAQDYRKYRPDYADIYYARAATGGGAILDCASHFIDLLVWMFGEIAEVTAVAEKLDFEKTECEDTVFLLFRFRETPILAEIYINQFQKPNESRLEASGTAGNLVLDEIHGTLSFASDDSGRWETEGGDADPETFMDRVNDRFTLQAHRFLDAVEGRPEFLATLDDGIHNLRAALAAKQSAAERRAVRV